MKMAEMVERELLPVGTKLTIKDLPDSAVRVTRGKLVEFHEERMTPSHWGLKVTDKPSINIYEYAVLREHDLDATNSNLRLLKSIRPISLPDRFDSVRLIGEAVLRLSQLRYPPQAVRKGRSPDHGTPFENS